jgi:V8-like Glu-specific endopeptidase
MSKILFSLLFFLSLVVNLQAQTAKIGNPRSWAYKNADTRQIPVHTMPAFDIAAQLRSDAINEANKIGPWRFGYEHNVNFGLFNGGHWTVLPNGDRIWRIIFRSQDALSMNILFNKFKLPDGAFMYIYSEDRAQFDGAYTSANNNSDNMLGTSLIQGSNLVVEYYEPAAVVGLGELNIGTVIHGYKSLSLYASGLLKGLNDSGNCNFDVKCPLGNGWENQINSVAIIIVGGSGACTGSLVNNTANDGKPYFLTANHCGSNGFGNWVFRFNWDSPNALCAQNGSSTDPGAPFNQVNGAVRRANSAGSDFSLLELNAIPTGDIYYSGWNRSNTPATQATAIHHPSGDVKKISRENNALTSSTWSGAQIWEVGNWDSGTTEGGSSGSPLFDQNQRVIGQLYGGGAACSGLTNNGQPDYYGRFDISWVGGGTNSTRLSNWLDPSGLAVTTLDGYNPNATGLAIDAGLSEVLNLSGNYCNQNSFAPELAMRNFGASAMTSAVITYNIDGGANSIYNWSGSLASGLTTTVTLPSISISVSGAHVFNATVTAPNGQVDSNLINNTANSSFYVTLGGQSADLMLLTDCYADETSWEIRNGSTVLYSGGPYQTNSVQTINSNFCLSDGCYSFVIFDSYGDGLDGSFCQGQLDGYYYIFGPQGDTIVTFSNPNFGDSIVHNFCISTPSAYDNSISKLNDVKVFPNPNKGQFTVTLSMIQAMDAELEVFNAMGQLLETSQYNGSSIYNCNINLSDQAAGFYFVKARIGNEVFTRKVLKE